MTATNKPSSAELRISSAELRARASKGIEQAGYVMMLPAFAAVVSDELLAGADAMDSLAAVQAQRDRLADALRRIAVYNTNTTLVDCRDIAAATLAELEGGAS